MIFFYAGDVWMEQEGQKVCDQEHEVLDIHLFCGAKLHRFFAENGEPWSAIYIGEQKYISCARDREQAMIAGWNEGRKPR